MHWHCTPLLGGRRFDAQTGCSLPIQRRFYLLDSLANCNTHHCLQTKCSANTYDGPACHFMTYTFDLAEVA